MSPPAAAGPLAGKGVLVTRPADQAGALGELIRDRGGRPFMFPAIEIVDIADLEPLWAVIDRLGEFDLAIFISPNAVNKALNLIRARRALPPRLRIAAIGKGSVRELKRFGVRDVLAPAARADSEALLALPELADVAGWRIVIFRGEGGRELLGDTLTARGAAVEYAECYRRARPAADSGALLKAWARNEIAAVTVTSSEALRNLFELVGKLGQAWLRKTPLFVPHPRIAETARELGIGEVVVTEEGDAGLVAGICDWFAVRGG